MCAFSPRDSCCTVAATVVARDALQHSEHTASHRRVASSSSTPAPTPSTLAAALAAADVSKQGVAAAAAVSTGQPNKSSLVQQWMNGSTLPSALDFVPPYSSPSSSSSPPPLSSSSQPRYVQLITQVAQTLESNPSLVCPPPSHLPSNYVSASVSTVGWNMFIMIVWWFMRLQVPKSGSKYDV